MTHRNPSCCRHHDHRQQRYPIIRSQTKVETQNLASPVLPIPTYACDNTLASNAPLPCRDAKSCVSRPVPCRHAHAIIRWQHTHFSLVRRKILRLYKAGALNMHAYIPHIRHAFLSFCRSMAVKIHAASYRSMTSYDYCRCGFTSPADA